MWSARIGNRGRHLLADDDDLESVGAPDGGIVGVNVAAEEITERKRAEAALRASERQFHTLADSIPQLVWVAEADGRIFWVNSHWYDYTGVPTGDGSAHDWQALL